MEKSNAYSFDTFESETSIDKNIMDELNRTLTKSHREILNVLHSSPNLTPKSLSARLGKSPNSLSNMLSRINEINPHLIHDEKVGREKQLRLGTIGIAYLEAQESSSDKPKKILKFSNSARDEALKNALLSLNNFKKCDPDNWLLKLDDCLTDHMNIDENPLLYTAYNKFIDNIRTLRIKGYLITLQTIYDHLNNEIIVKRIQETLDQLLNHFYQLETLFNLTNEKPQIAFEIIDDMFLKIFPDVWGGLPTVSSIPHKNLFPEATYASTYYQISNMVHTAVLNHWEKNQAIEQWEKSYCTSNVIFYYIAEKCKTIQTIQSIKQGKSIL